MVQPDRFARCCANRPPRKRTMVFRPSARWAGLVYQLAHRARFQAARHNGSRFALGFPRQESFTGGLGVVVRLPLDLPGWQKLYSEQKDKNFEIISIAQDTGGVKDTGNGSRPPSRNIQS